MIGESKLPLGLLYSRLTVQTNSFDADPSTVSTATKSEKARKLCNPLVGQSAFDGENTEGILLFPMITEMSHAVKGSIQGPARKSQTKPIGMNLMCLPLLTKAPDEVYISMEQKPRYFPILSTFEWIITSSFGCACEYVSTKSRTETPKRHVWSNMLKELVDISS